MLGEDGALDRAKLAAVVFADGERRRELERITHPKIARTMGRRALRAWLGSGRDTLVALEIPLAFEARSYNGALLRFSPVLAVTATPATQLERLMDRDKVGALEAERRIEAQGDGAFRARHSDFVIANDGSLEALRRATDTFLGAWRAQSPLRFVAVPPRRFAAPRATGAKGGPLARLGALVLAFSPRQVALAAGAAALVAVWGRALRRGGE